MTDTRSRLIHCFSAVFADLTADQVPLAERATVKGWDSLANLSLITVIEEEFAIQIEPEDVDHFVSFARILDYLDKKG